MKMKKAKFPGLNTTRWIKFCDEHPEPGEGESKDAFKRRVALFEALKDAELEVALRARATVLGFEDRYRLAVAREEARLAPLEGPTSSNLAFVEEVTEIHREVVEAYVTGVRGIEVGDVDLETLRDAKLIATLLETAGLLADASRLARNAQAPTPLQLERSGSS
jgi:hypothetical protein